MFKKILLSAGLLAICLAAGAAGDRPNFLFIFTDDQRWDAMSVVQKEQGEQARFPWFTTPNMDRLAAEGVRFRNAFVVLSLCSPSRAAFLTGRYNHLNGIANNHTPFPEDAVTFASLLRAAGYKTGYVGKWHMGPQRGQRPGFDFSASFVGQGRYFDCPIEVNGRETPSKGWVDDVSTDYALAFLKENRATPFALVLGFKTCHGPFEPAERAQARFEGAEARAVPNFDTPAIYKPAGAQPAKRKSGQSPVRTNLGYFRGLSAVDDNLGRLLDVLQELNLADRTVVVFTSDNGFYLGEHGLGDKRTAYDESMRIPLLVRYPRLFPKGEVRDELVLNIDVAPTFLAAAGLEAPAQMQGRDLARIWTAKTTPWRTAFFYEYFQERNFGAPTVLAVRTQNAKLIKYPGHDDWTEVFDLKTDPYETRNLVNEPAARPLRQTLEAEFERQAKLVGFRFPEFADPATAEPGRATPAVRLDRDVLQFDFARDQGDRVVDSSGANNHGTASGAPVVDGRAGKKARKFDGKAHLEVPRSASLNPADGPWSVEAVVKPEQPDGMIVARGGKTQGYALWLKDGKPLFTVNSGNNSRTVAGKTAVTVQWTTLAGVITADRRMVLYVDGQPTANAPLKQFIAADPNDSMQVGADLRSSVLDPAPPQFSGLIESVRVYSGELKP